MQFRVLGPLEVSDDGRPIAIGGQKQRALLALLLLHANEVVSRDRLIDELWEEDPPETARTALQVHISQLRKAVGRERILTQAPGYRAAVGPGELDLDRFEQLVGDGANGAELREALALWRGAPLAELGDGVARMERGRLEEQRLLTLERRIDADLALGRHAELVPELDGLVREHPLREHLRGPLMLALSRCGRQAPDPEFVFSFDSFHPQQSKQVQAGHREKNEPCREESLPGQEICLEHLIDVAHVLEHDGE